MVTGFGNNYSFGLLCVSFVNFCLFVCIFPVLVLGRNISFLSAPMPGYSKLTLPLTFR